MNLGRWLWYSAAPKNAAFAAFNALFSAFAAMGSKNARPRYSFAAVNKKSTN